MTTSETLATAPGNHRELLQLRAIAVALGGLYLGIAGLSSQFSYGSPSRERPVLLFLGLLGVCFGLHLVALRSALRSPNSARVWRIILWAAVAYRATLLSSQPILEADYYRYLWDGAVLAQGASPYQYSPEAALNAIRTNQPIGGAGRVAKIATEHASLSIVLKRVHFAELTTVYPPVSQTVFAMVHCITPGAAPVIARIVILKGVLVGFDLATLLVVASLLRLVKRHVGWSILYAWCPLVLKEVANSGHLDAIAVFLSVSSVTCLVKSRQAPSTGRQWLWLLGSALLLGLAIGAKLYPLILLPVLTACAVSTIGRWGGFTFALTASVLGAAALAPMVVTRSGETTATLTSSPEPALPGESSAPVQAEDSRPPAGLTAFLSRWQINDLIFSLVAENLQPESNAWYVATSDNFRESYAQRTNRIVGQTGVQAGFLGARILTGIAFMLIASCLAHRAGRASGTEIQLEAVFLTLAWFWLLQPTQNPWYWTWAIPFLPFARERAWYAVSGIVTLYYLRFWLTAHWPNTPVLGSGYDGKDFFDHVVTWCEFLPWMGWLATSWLLRRTNKLAADSGTPTTVGCFTDAPVA